MKKYLTFFRIRFLAGLQYRTAALAGMSTQLVWGAMEILLYRAFYLQSPETFPMGMQALVSYIWLQQGLLTVFNTYMMEQELFESVQTGAVAYELVRPTELYGMWTARSFALRASRGALRFFPVVLIASLLPAPYGLRLPVSLPAFGLFLLSTCLTLWVSVAICMVCYAMSFFLVDARGLISLLAALTDLLGGGVVPLPFLPDGLRQVAEWSPFGSLQNVPLRIFGGDIALDAAPSAVALQLFWAAALTLLGYGLMRRGVRRAVVAGG